MGNVTLNGSAAGSFVSTLHGGTYGFFRSVSTNGVYHSTNAFGATVGSLATNGYCMIGNPFDAQNVSDILPQPVENLKVYRWDNANSQYVQVTYRFGSWNNSMTVNGEEGVIVYNPTSTAVPYIFTGLFTTNAISTSLPTGYSMLCTPLYQIVTANSYVVDVLDSGTPGGASNLPVQSPGFDPQAYLFQMIDAAETYRTNIFTGSGFWQTNGVNASISLKLAEGFWLSKPTNSTWTVSRPIW